MVDTTLKDMLLSLQSSLMTGISLFTNISTDMHVLDERVTHIENSMKECTTTVNDIIDTYDEIKEEQSWVRDKLADLEDRSRRNNIKLKGIPESILPPNLPKFAKELMHTILLDVSHRDLLVDRIHRISKPSHLAASIPWDVLMRVHFFHVT